MPIWWQKPWINESLINIKMLHWNIFDFTNLVKAATCFMKHCTSSLVDVFLTNKPNFCFNILNSGCGISDWHNLIGVVVKGATARVEKKHTKYRSYKNFDETEFSEDVGRIPFHAAYVFNDIDDIYWVHEWLLADIINEHAPIKERVTKARKPAYMNANLRRAVFKKRMLFNKFKKSKTPANWELYRKQRNHVTKLKKASMRVYFFERCAGGPKSKDFWPTIKPFLSKKGSDGGSEVILCEENKVISDQAEVCTLFNSFLAHLSRRLTRWAYRMGLEPASVRASVHTFKHEYLRDQQADFNQILSEASLGWGKGCIRFWCRPDQNSGFHGNG